MTPDDQIPCPTCGPQSCFRPKHKTDPEAPIGHCYTCNWDYPIEPAVYARWQEISRHVVYAKPGARPASPFFTRTRVGKLRL